MTTDTPASPAGSALLTLLRHGKSSWSDSALSDHDRPLNERGRRDVPRIARHLGGLAGIQIPDIIFASSAQRTRETARLVCDELDLEPDARVKVVPELYLASLPALQQFLRQALQPDAHMLVVGHNPELSELCLWLDDASPDGLPTSAFCQYRLAPGPWSDTAALQARLIHWITPKSLRR